MRDDYVSIIEAAYAPADSEEAWLQGIADAALPCLDRGLGVNAYTFDARNSADFRMPSFVGVGGAPDREAADQIIGTAHTTVIERLYRPGPPAYFMDMAKHFSAEGLPGVEATVSELPAIGAQDMLGVRGGDASRRGCIIAVPCAGRGRLPPAEAKLLGCVGAHLASGWRLRQAHAEIDDADAVLDARGKLLHARADDAGAQRHRINGAFGRRSQARGSLRREDPRSAVALWHAMVQGEWTLVDHQDTDGKRFVLARRNRPGVPDIAALDLRERQVATYAACGFSLKHIGYELGLGVSTVSEKLKSAMRKLRLRSRAELVAVLGPACGTGSEAEA